MLFKNNIIVSEFENYLKEKKNLSDSSIDVYMDFFEKFFVENSDSLKDIDAYNDFIIKHAIKKRSNYVYSILKNFIRFYIDDAGKRGQMIEDLIKPQQNKNIKRERKTLSEEQIIKVINNMKKMKHRIIALIQDLTGVRAGDVLRLERGNIIPEVYEGENVLKLIIEGKGNKRNVVYIHDDVVQKLIVNFIIKNIFMIDYYFMEERSYKKNQKRWEQRNYKANYRAYYRDLKQALHKLGFQKNDFATHDYRRCYASRVWKKYKDFKVLQDLLNHSDPSTTMRYLEQTGMDNIEYHKEMQKG